MESWYKIVTDDWDIADKFTKIWLRNLSPKDAALFGTVMPRHRKPRDYYLSPKAAQIADGLIVEYVATPCPRPKAAGLSLLVGDQSTLALLAENG